MVVPEEKPEAPEGITIKGGYKELTVNWKKHNSAQSFDVYYRKLGDNSEFVKANDEAIINVTSYTISNLDENASYEVKMTATNHLGTSAMSKGYVGETTAIKIPITPNYKLINTPNGVNQLTSNIVSIEFPITAGNDHQGIFDEDCVVDNDYSTAWTIDDWDAGHYSKRGPIVTFSEEHTINRIAMIARVDSVGATPYMANIGVFNEEENKWEYHDAKISNYNNNGAYVILKLDTPITGTKFQVNPSVYGGNKLSISELKFYDYDDVEADVENLFADELKLTLRQESQEDNILAVTQEEIDAIRVKLNTKDIVSGEYHPERDSLLEEVLIAEQLLNDENLSEKIIEIDPLINGSGANTGYNNDWQALGFAAKAGDTIDIYLSNDQPNRDIYFGYEQHYGESGSYISSKKIVLKPGKNTIQIDSLHDINVEKGGNLYVRFPYNVDSSTAKIYVRVSGATEIPHLNLNNDLVDVNYMVNNKDSNNEDILEVKAKIKEYILSLKEHVNTLEDKYPKTASEKDNLNNIYTYDEKTSILNTTNIEGDRFTLTLPSTEIYKGITSGIENDLDAQIDRVYDAILAWEQIIQITNSKKGVYESLNDFNGNGQIDDEDKAEYNSNKASKSRVNVKYQRMFIGAFMYASGHHVGIDAGSSVSLMQGVPYKFNEDGTIANADEAKLFGWGIGHEIGHKADIVNRTYSETTNNLLPMLIQTFDMTTKSRLEENDVYTKIYEKVTSQSVGLEQDISTLLGMFWQLHLAYEDSATYEMLNNNNDNNPDNDSFFAKLNRAYRNTKAETTDKDQLLIRRASDAANKDLRAFFASWGLIADESTSIYLQEKFSESDRETRKIQYLNDEAFRKRIEGITDMSENTSVVASFDGVNDGDIVNSDSVTLNLNVNQDADKILGYEILRSDGNTNENGETKVKYREVGFVNANEDGSATFTDSIAPLNNRAITYKVVAYDYNLNPTEEFTVGSVKLSHDGSIDSNGFTLTSNLTSDIEGSPIENIKDGDSSTVFKARKLTKDEYNSDPHKVDNIDINADPYIIIDLKGSKSITGLKYTKSDDAISKLSLRNIFAKDTSFNAIDKYEIYISDDNKDFTKVSEGKFEFGKDSVLGGSNGDNIAKVLFEEDSNLMTYDARYVKLVAVGAKNIDIADIELIGTTGDNIEIGFIDATTNTKVNGVGRIDEDYVLQADNTDTLEDDSVIIPKDSIVIIGEYKGNPAFNIPLLIDKNNKTINGEVALMANVPEDAELGTVASGTWIYWLSKEDFNRLTDSVKAELYRYDKLVDGAPVGQRLVSDTLYTNITATDFNGLPLISIANSVNIDNELDTKVKKSTNTEVVYTNSKIITR
jgi:hypothetical protein